ncbi:ferredoxin [Amycolatopsis ultiminotia]|uniref:Ferredoxin n=1 Tax=Amycolatopsis ultiminotia TaxID=543629 RepID=A0ABP6V463_9PSEU
MRIMVDTNKCSGHARCAALAPHVYALDDQGYAVPFDGEVAPEDEKAAVAGVHACPERAITADRRSSASAGR